MFLYMIFSFILLLWIFRPQEPASSRGFCQGYRLPSDFRSGEFCVEKRNT